LGTARFGDLMILKVPDLTTSVTIILLLSALFFGEPAFCAVNSEAYVNRTYGFSINPPSGWVVNDTGVSPPHVVTFYGPTIPETGGKTNIYISSGTATASLDDYVAAVKQGYALNFTNYNLVSEGNRSIGGLGGYELVITGTYMPEANAPNTHPFDVKQKQIILVENGKAYGITFTASPTSYDEYLPAFEESLQTFTVLGQESPWPTPLYMLIIGIVIGAWSIVSLGILIKWRKTKTQKEQASF
jgi:hypothetical protein